MAGIADQQFMEQGRTGPPVADDEDRRAIGVALCPYGHKGGAGEDGLKRLHA